MNDTSAATHLAIARDLPDTDIRISVIALADHTIPCEIRLDWQDWRPASAGHRLIEHGWTIDAAAFYRPAAAAGWSTLPGIGHIAPVRPLHADNGAPAPRERGTGPDLGTSAELDQIRARDAAKGHSGAGITMTQPEADRRALLRLLDNPPAATTVARDTARQRERHLIQWGEHGQHHRDGTGPDITWATTGPADQVAQRAIEKTRRLFAEGMGTWREVLFEELAEAFAQDDPALLRPRLIRVAAVAQDWAADIDDRAQAASPQEIPAELPGFRGAGDCEPCEGTGLNIGLPGPCPECGGTGGAR